MVRLVFAMTLISLICAAAPGVAAAEEPAWPAEPLEFSLIFDSDGPNGSVGLWMWNSKNFVGGNDGPVFWSPRWEWHPLDKSGVFDILVVGEPAQPADLSVFQTVAGIHLGSGEQGYWVWNPLRFVQKGDGSVLQSPAWIWAPKGEQVTLWE
ncbi:MAG: hypothetical protein ACUVX1_02635 [Chloroflexota bacterium]|mgnify:CR=1 FL=1